MTNQPDWNSVCCSGVLAAKTNHISAKVRMSNSELMGPKNTMKRPRSAGFQRSGWRTSSSSTLSKGMAICERSYSRFCTSRCSGSMGRKGMKAEATDRKSTRLNSSHLVISYAVFCLKKKKERELHADRRATCRDRHPRPHHVDNSNRRI